MAILTARPLPIRFAETPYDRLGFRGSLSARIDAGKVSRAGLALHITNYRKLDGEIEFLGSHQGASAFSLETGTCHVPPAESVALNVPVDDTVGTYVGGGGGASAEDIYAYFTADSRADAFKADVSALALEATVSAIPINPLLTNDVRLDNLDATVSSRLATSGYTAPNNAGIAAIPTNPLLTTDARLDNLNATIGSRLASVDYTEPDNTSIGEIKTKVDSLENAPTVQDIRVELEDPPLPVNTTKMNDEVIVGKGIPSDLWRGSGV